jgi:hypothetical protein
MGDNGFHTWFREFATETAYSVWGNPNASATKEASTQAPRATELAVSGASELHKHQWLRPDNGVIECATCGDTRNYYGE